MKCDCRLTITEGKYKWHVTHHGTHCHPTLPSVRRGLDPVAQIDLEQTIMMAPEVKLLGRLRSKYTKSYLHVQLMITKKCAYLYI